MKLKSECPQVLKPLKSVLSSSATVDDHLALLISVSWTWLPINIVWSGSTETINGFRLYVKFHDYVGAHLSRTLDQKYSSSPRSFMTCNIR
jgi:hypothetical protein